MIQWNWKTEEMYVIKKKSFKEKGKNEHHTCCYAMAEKFALLVVFDGVRVACIHVSGYNSTNESVTRTAFSMGFTDPNCFLPFQEENGSLALSYPKSFRETWRKSERNIA